MFRVEHIMGHYLLLTLADIKEEHFLNLPLTHPSSFAIDVSQKQRRDPSLKRLTDWGCSTRKTILIINTSRGGARWPTREKGTADQDRHNSKTACIEQKWWWSRHLLERPTVITTRTVPVRSQPSFVLEAAPVNFAYVVTFLWIWFLGQSHGPLTPPSTPKTDVHMASKQEVRRPTDTGSIPPTSRQNIDFTKVDISDLGPDVIGTIDAFDVHEFEQYLSPNNRGPTALPPSDTGHVYPTPSGSFIVPGIHSHSIPTSTQKGPTSTETLSQEKPIQSEDANTRKPQVKTEQVSPDHHSGSCTSSPPPLQPEGTPGSTPSASSTHPPDLSDRQSCGFYSTISGYAAPLYQRPYFHPSCMPYAAPLINSLALAPPSHSPPSGWEQSIYTTLTRPWTTTTTATTKICIFIEFLAKFGGILNCAVFWNSADRAVNLKHPSYLSLSCGPPKQFFILKMNKILAFKSSVRIGQLLYPLQCPFISPTNMPESHCIWCHPSLSQPTRKKAKKNPQKPT